MATPFPVSSSTPGSQQHHQRSSPSFRPLQPYPPPPPPPPPQPSAHLQRTSYSSKTLVLDHMLFLQTDARLRQLRRSLAAGDGPPVDAAELDGFGKARASAPSRAGKEREVTPISPFEATAAELMDVEDPAALDEKASGYERMLSVLLERVKLASGVSTPVPEAAAFDSDDDDDYIVAAPEQEGEDDLLPEGVRLRLGLAGLVDVLSRRDDADAGWTNPQPPVTPSSPVEGSRDQQATLSTLAPLFSTHSAALSGLPAPPLRIASLFDQGVSPAEAGPSTARAHAALEHPPSRRPSLAAFSTNGFAPAPDRWYDLPPSADSFAAPLDGTLGNRWVELLERFLVLSAAVAESVGASRIEEEERRQRTRLNARGARSSPLRPGGSVVAARPGEQALLWESDSEASVDDDDDSPDASADEGSTAGRNLSAVRTQLMKRRISNTPVRQLSGAFESPASPASTYPPRPSSTSASPSPPPQALATPVPVPAGPNRSLVARPTRAWHALLASLLLQVVLSGFLSHGWRGLPAARAVLSIGRGARGEAGGLGRAGWVLFGSGRKFSRRKEECERVLEGYWRELTSVPDDTSSLRAHIEHLAARHPPHEVELALLHSIESSSNFLGVPELARSSQPPPQPTPSLRGVPLHSLLNPFPTYQQEPPTPPSNPSRAPRRQGVNRYFVAPRLRRERPAVAGVKREREAGAEEEGEGDERARHGGMQGARPPLIVVEDWPDPYGV